MWNVVESFLLTSSLPICFTSCFKFSIPVNFSANSLQVPERPCSHCTILKTSVQVLFGPPFHKDREREHGSGLGPYSTKHFSLAQSCHSTVDPARPKTTALKQIRCLELILVMGKAVKKQQNEQFGRIMCCLCMEG
jgi:hypothetical protein